MSYILTSGFETHVELKTATKIFCSCESGFGGEPNTRCCPVCLGLPGALPRLNARVVEFAVKAGLALNCKINNVSTMDRKNYSYPDLTKAYQITQYDIPICENGYVILSSGKKIGITRIHIEEDAGKLIHNNNEVLADYNRTGVPLIEIVSEPDIESAQEAREYVEKLRLIMRYIEVSDCKMQEGSMRCDVNVSVRRSDTDSLGTRTEIKNMNSISNITKAIEYEYNRQISILESGKRVVQETLGYDEKKGVTYSMRSKEDADDYRYFSEPDLPKVYVSDEQIEKIRESLPELFDAKVSRYVSNLGVKMEDALLLAQYPKVALFFEKSIQGLTTQKIAANFILGQVFRSFKTESDKESFNVKIKPCQLTELCLLCESGKLSNNLAKSALENMLATGKGVKAFISDKDMCAVNAEELLALCQSVAESNPKACADYRGGKDNALKALLGAVMRESKGKADAVKATEILKALLA